MNEPFTPVHSDEYCYDDQSDKEFQRWFQRLLSKRLEEGHPIIDDLFKEEE